MRGAAAGRQRTAMTAVACPLADPFAAAEQAYATITEFLPFGEGATGESCTSRERE